MTQKTKWSNATKVTKVGEEILEERARWLLSWFKAKRPIAENLSETEGFHCLKKDLSSYVPVTTNEPMGAQLVLWGSGKSLSHRLIEIAGTSNNQ